tara:strand:+ start:3710 stop:6766 length:3057 start_codon:yes stop_codon:yes gene_type:complete
MSDSNYYYGAVESDLSINPTSDFFDQHAEQLKGRFGIVTSASDVLYLPTVIKFPKEWNDRRRREWYQTVNWNKNATKKDVEQFYFDTQQWVKKFGGWEPKNIDTLDVFAVPVIDAEAWENDVKASETGDTTFNSKYFTGEKPTKISVEAKRDDKGFMQKEIGADDLFTKGQTNYFSTYRDAEKDNVLGRWSQFGAISTASPPTPGIGGGGGGTTVVEGSQFTPKFSYASTDTDDITQKLTGAPKDFKEPKNIQQDNQLIARLIDEAKAPLTEYISQKNNIPLSEMNQLEIDFDMDVDGNITNLVVRKAGEVTPLYNYRQAGYNDEDDPGTNTEALNSFNGSGTDSFSVFKRQKLIDPNYAWKKLGYKVQTGGEQGEDSWITDKDGNRIEGAIVDTDGRWINMPGSTAAPSYGATVTNATATANAVKSAGFASPGGLPPGASNIAGGGGGNLDLPYDFTPINPAQAFATQTPAMAAGFALGTGQLPGSANPYLQQPYQDIYGGLASAYNLALQTGRLQAPTIGANLAGTPIQAPGLGFSQFTQTGANILQGLQSDLASIETVKRKVQAGGGVTTGLNEAELRLYNQLLKDPATEYKLRKNLIDITSPNQATADARAELLARQYSLGELTMPGQTGMTPGFYGGLGGTMGQTAVTPLPSMMTASPSNMAGTGSVPSAMPAPAPTSSVTPTPAPTPASSPSISATANSVNNQQTTVTDLAELNQKIDDANTAINMATGTNNSGINIPDYQTAAMMEGMNKPTLEEYNRSPGLYPGWTLSNMNTVVASQSADVPTPNPYTPAMQSPTDTDPYKVFNVDNAIARGASGTLIDDRTGSATEGKMLTINNGVITEAYQIDMNSGQKVNLDLVTGLISGQQFAQTNPNTGEQQFASNIVPTAGTALGSGFGVPDGFGVGTYDPNTFSTSNPIMANVPANVTQGLGLGANNNALATPAPSIQYPLGPPMSAESINEFLSMPGNKPPMGGLPQINTPQAILMQQGLKQIANPVIPIVDNPWLNMGGVM